MFFQLATGYAGVWYGVDLFDQPGGARQAADLRGNGPGWHELSPAERLVVDEI